MANSNVPMFVQTITTGVQQVLPADTTSLKTLVTAGANGSRVSSIVVSTTDTTTRDLQLWLTRSATSYLIGTVNIPLSAGNVNSAPSINILGNSQIPGLPLDANGNPYIDLKAADVLAIATTTTVTAAKAENAVAVCGDF